VIKSSTPRAYGFVFEYLENISLAKDGKFIPVSLHDILSQRNYFDLPLRRRIRLAYLIVRAVAELHTVCLLHKNISSMNILFFEKEGSSDLSRLFENPYFINLRDSRPSDDSWATRRPTAHQGSAALYKHPDYAARESYFQQTFDYYSIGLVLLELGGWRTLDEYKKLSRDPQSVSVQSLIDKYVPRLCSSMGETYRDATVACLSSQFGQGTGDGLGGAEKPVNNVLEQYYNRVVSPLHRLSEFPI
jgi:serine/threonine protein kinase